MNLEFRVQSMGQVVLQLSGTSNEWTVLKKKKNEHDEISLDSGSMIRTTIPVD